MNGPITLNDRLRSYALLFPLAIGVLLIDQLTKSAVMRSMRLGESISIIDPVFSITYSENTGSAFGLLPQAGSVFLVLAVIICTLMLIFYPRIDRSLVLTRIGVALVLGGALGNAYDRATIGAVIDFIHYTLPNVISNVSNLADHAIVGGVILILIDSWITEPRRRAKQKAQADLASPADRPPPEGA